MDSRLPPPVNTLRSDDTALVAFRLTIPFTGRFTQFSARSTPSRPCSSERKRGGHGIAAAALLGGLCFVLPLTGEAKDRRTGSDD